ncbi:hypothetical protein BIW11_09554 [Tropilaelaps mercedesae]|uniref:Sodium/potassium-transporting ATPase subunit beta-1-like n=1 Tax=Tropilaelaps mercedesae TaxID=418985 RepID=A0A1V9XJS7_9ACAR|nr:hypothetical protein BIW11_09554 [Tropilaelaps mercedesae]
MGLRTLYGRAEEDSLVRFFRPGSDLHVRLVGRWFRVLVSTRLGGLLLGPSSIDLLCRCRLGRTMTGGSAALAVMRKLRPLQLVLPPPPAHHHPNSSSSHWGRKGRPPSRRRLQAHPIITSTMAEADIMGGTSLVTEAITVATEATPHSPGHRQPLSHPTRTTRQVATIHRVDFSRLRTQRTIQPLGTDGNSGTCIRRPHASGRHPPPIRRVRWQLHSKQRKIQMVEVSPTNIIYHPITTLLRPEKVTSPRRLCFQVTPPCTDLELLDAWPGRSDDPGARNFCCSRSCLSTSRKGVLRWLRICCSVLTVLILIAAVAGLVIFYPLGGAQLLELKSYHGLNRFLRLHPTPKGKQLLIHYKHGASEGEALDWRTLVRELDDLLAKYDLDRALGDPNLTDCSSARPQTKRPDRHKQCLFDIRHIDRYSRLGLHGPSLDFAIRQYPYASIWKCLCSAYGVRHVRTQTHVASAFFARFCGQRFDRECSSENNYGYDRGKPCVFLQFSSARDFQPRVVEGSDTVAVDCFGNTVVDQENMGSLVYTPDPGYKLVYFPAGPSPPYMPPLIAVQFVQPTVGVAIGVTCTIYSSPGDAGSGPGAVGNASRDPVDYWDRKQVHFNLLIE